MPEDMNSRGERNFQLKINKIYFYIFRSSPLYNPYLSFIQGLYKLLSHNNPNWL